MLFFPVDVLRRLVSLLNACFGAVCLTQEAPIEFPPTYRMEKGRDDYSNKNNQNASYTDRILYRSLHGLESNVTPLFYGANMALELVGL